MSSNLSTDILLERFDVIACSNCNQPIDLAGQPPFSAVRCPACGADMRIPARFANFILLEQLGRGGMGAVYKAYDETLGRTVALKVMQQSIGQDRAFVDQFLQEARALAAINHPNIVQIYSYGEENGQPYIVMELVDGDRLDHIHVKHHSLDERFVLQMALQVISGLQAANAAGMTHGDIKPANILFDRAGNAKVADFGLARLNGQKPKPGEIWGTPYYVAPEVVRGQAPNAGSDIYSLGGTLYHVLTGEPPFNGETVTDTVLLRFKEPAPDPRTLKPGISERTSAILLRMLAMDPFLRYPTFESVSKDIAAALAALLEAKNGSKKKSGSRVLGPVLLSLVALALIGGGSWFGHAVFKAKQAERLKQEQFDRDLAEGRIIKRFVHGKLAYVRVDPDAKSGASADKTAGVAPEAPAAAPVTHWELPATADVVITGDNESSEFQDRTVLTLRAGNSGALDKASKIYLRFSLAGVDRARLSEAVLQLTAGRKGAKKVRDNPYVLTVWALKTPQAWDDSLRWNEAPGNLAGHAGAMDEKQAEAVVTYRIPANPETGDRFFLRDDALARFLRTYEPDDLTLVLTADVETDQKGGWRFTSTEDIDRFTPPTLILDAEK